MKKFVQILLLTLVVAILLEQRSADALRLPQFINIVNQMVCGKVKSPQRYWDYGCYCGIYNTEGPIIDELDECCKQHDLCFKNIQAEKPISSTWYTVWCIFGNRCSGSGKEREICECDRQFAYCLRSHQNVYKVIYQKWRKCK